MKFEIKATLEKIYQDTVVKLVEVLPLPEHAKKFAKDIFKQSKLTVRVSHQPKFDLTPYLINLENKLALNKFLFYVKVVRSCFLWIATAISVLGHLNVGIYFFIIWFILKLPTLPFTEPINPKMINS